MIELLYCYIEGGPRSSKVSSENPINCSTPFPLLGSASRQQLHSVIGRGRIE
jgi:hypothetical protein